MDKKRGTNIRCMFNMQRQSSKFHKQTNRKKHRKGVNHLDSIQERLSSRTILQKTNATYGSYRY